MTAPAPPNLVVGGPYGFGFVEFLIVEKCADSIPIHRIERRFGRLGIPSSRSTMNDLVHTAARKVPAVSADPDRSPMWAHGGTLLACVSRLRGPVSTSTERGESARAVISNGAAARNNVNEDHGDGQYEQKVNEPTPDVKGGETE